MLDWTKLEIELNQIGDNQGSQLNVFNNLENGGGVWTSVTSSEEEINSIITSNFAGNYRYNFTLHDEELRFSISEFIPAEFR